MRLKSLFEKGAARPDYVAGFRAATATIVPLVIGDLTGHPQFIWVALGGWLATFADPGGPYPLRAATLLAYVAVSAASIAAGSIAAIHPWSGIVLLFLWAVGCALLRVYGEAAGTVGSLALIAFCIALGTPVPDLGALELRTALFAAGGLWAAGLALALWPVHPYRPVRRAIAACHHALAAHVHNLDAGGPGWFDAAANERRAIRASLENARSVIALVRGERRGDSRRAELLTALYESAELCLGDLSALAETLQSREEQGEPRPHLALDAVAKTFDAVAHATTEEPSGAIAVPEKLEGLEGLGSHLQIAVIAANALHGRGEAAPLQLRAVDSPARRSIKSALTPRSLELQHAIRVGLTAAAAALLGLLLHRVRRYWIIVTAIIVIQPNSGATLRKGIQRIAGTVAGAIAASLLAPLFHGHLQTAALLFVLALFGAAARRLNYAVYIALITPLFVLLAESSSGDWQLIQVRVSSTLLGGAVAILGSYALWPHRERDRLPSLLATVLRQTRSLLEKPSADVRREVGLALTNADAAFERFLDERPTDAEVEAVMAVRSMSRRLVGAVVALSQQGSFPAGLAPAAEQIGAALEQMAAAAEKVEKPPPLAPLPREAERLARPVEVIHAALARLAEPFERSVL
jgi:uncharacterized membrane protein YccC